MTSKTHPPPRQVSEDEVLRRMLNTPPKPHKAKVRPAKKTAADKPNKPKSK